MILKTDLRIGYLVYLGNNRRDLFQIMQLKSGSAFLKHKGVTQAGYDLLAPVPISFEVLERCGFVELEGNLQKTTSAEYCLSIGVAGDIKNGIYALIDSKDETLRFAKAMINGHHAGNRLIYLHQVQNMYHALSTRELEIP